MRGGRLLNIICYFAVKANLMIVALKSSIDCTWNRLSDTTSWYPSSSNSHIHLHPNSDPIFIQFWYPSSNFDPISSNSDPTSSNFDCHLHPMLIPSSSNSDAHLQPILMPIFIQFWYPSSSNFDAISSNFDVHLHPMLTPSSSNSETHLHGQYVKRSCWNSVFYPCTFLPFPSTYHNKCFV